MFSTPTQKEHMRFKTTKKHRSTTNMKEDPQVRKTGADAVHEKLPAEGLYHEEM